MNQWSTTVHAVQKRKHERTLSEYNEERKRLLGIIEEQERQVEVALSIGDSKPSVTKIKMDKAMDGEATAFAIASDWHAEETIESKTVNGLNEFNLGIAEKRIEAFFKNVAKMTEIQRAGAKIDRLVLFLGGDLMTGYIHEELAEGNGLSPTETVLWLQDRVASGVEFLGKHFSEIVIPCSYGNHGRCHDHKTELLTKNGWKKYNEIEVGDEVATYRMKDGVSEWQPLSDVYVADYSGKMVHVKTNTADFMVTPHHRMVVKPAHRQEDEFIQMDEFIKKGTFGSFSWPKCSLGNSEEYSAISDTMLRLLGWAVTDSSYGHQNGYTSVRLHQSKEDGCSRIRSILDELGLQYGVHTRTREIASIKNYPVSSCKPENTFTLKKESSLMVTSLLPDKHSLPNWFRYLSTRQFNLFLKEVVQADGHSRGKESVVYGREHFLSQVQELAVTHGIPARLRKDKRGDFILSLPKSQRGYVNSFSKQVNLVDYDGVIWCGTVPNGTLITRRNGIPLVSGNTTQKSRIATGAKNSYEWMLYHVLKKSLSGKATWHVADGYHLYLDCYGRNIRFHHGDGLKYQGGIGGLTIPVEKAIASWNKGVTADLDVFGHWHQSQQNPKWISNGCLIGYGPYALSIKAPYEKPSQTFFLMDKKHGRTVTAPIFLD